MIKPSYDENRQILGEVFPLDTPFTVVLDSSEACNFRCSYCFRSDNNKQAWSYASKCDVMEWDTFLRAFDQIMEFPHDVKQISASHHGEPLVNKRLPLMVRHMRENGYEGRISMHTNASLLTPEYAVEIGEAGFSRIVISVQGVDSENYKRICSYGIDYEEFIHNIEILYKHSRNNEWSTGIYVKIADEALKGHNEDEFYSLFRNITDRMYVEKVVPIWKNIESGDIQKTDEMMMSKFGNLFPKQQCCRILFDTIVVIPNGDIYPCTQLLGPECMGNIFKTTLLEIWNSKERRSMMQDMLRLNSPIMCKECYIPQNSIYTEEDMIDDYREEILRRLDGH